MISDGPLWLDQVQCMGNETTLAECHHNVFGDHNCDHKEDVVVKCTKGKIKQYTHF